LSVQLYAEQLKTALVCGFFMRGIINLRAMGINSRGRCLRSYITCFHLNHKGIENVVEFKGENTFKVRNMQAWREGKLVNEVWQMAPNWLCINSARR